MPYSVVVKNPVNGEELTTGYDNAMDLVRHSGWVIQSTIRIAPTPNEERALSERVFVPASDEYATIRARRRSR